MPHGSPKRTNVSFFSSVFLSSLKAAIETTRVVKQVLSWHKHRWESLVLGVYLYGTRCSRTPMSHMIRASCGTQCVHIAANFFFFR